MVLGPSGYFELPLAAIEETTMLNSDIELTLEQEAIVRAAQFEVDKLELEELRLCLKQAIRNDLIQSNIIHQLAHSQAARKSRPRLVRALS